MRRPAVVVLALLAGAPPAGAQRVRVRSETVGRYVALTPIRYDTATGDFAAAERTSATPLTQDLELSAWGLGIAGLRAYGLLRFRGALGAELIWPRSDDHFDALWGFLELERPAYRVRLGRQQRAGGLGFYAFDGALATWRARPALRFEAYGGRGLARGFLEPLNSPEIRSLDPLRPDEGTILVGASAWGAPLEGSSVAASWQREILSDRSGLVSERVALDAQLPLGPLLVASGFLDGDLAAGAVGRARLAAQVRLPRRGFVELEVFRYRPIFDLTTIWGVFSPEGHAGAAVHARVGVSPVVSLTGSLTHRRYRAVTETTPFLPGVGNTATQLALGARWTAGDLAADASWRLHTGFGGAQSGGDLHVAWQPADAAWRAGLLANAFQEEEQFRVADGTVYGLGADARAAITPRLELRAELMRWWHGRGEGDAGLDWGQTRGLLAVSWTFGASADRVAGYR